MQSYDRFLEFVQRSKAVSPTFALATATALQVIVSKSWMWCFTLRKLTVIYLLLRADENWGSDSKSSRTISNGVRRTKQVHFFDGASYILLFLLDACALFLQ